MNSLEAVYARFVLGMGKVEAYYWASAEQEAYLNQHNLDYLAMRPLWAQFRYLKGKKRFRVTEVPGELVFY